MGSDWSPGLNPRFLGLNYSFGLLCSRLYVSSFLKKRLKSKKKFLKQGNLCWSNFLESPVLFFCMWALGLQGFFRGEEIQVRVY